MLKALLRVRLLAIGGWMSGGRMKKQSKTGKAAFAALAVVLGLTFVGMFYGFFSSIAGPFHEMGADVLYLSLFLLIDFCMMLLGNLFMVKAQLFEARDNELLLSLPIPPRMILLSRILMLLLLNYVFEALVAVPAAICWAQTVSVSASSAAAFLILCLLLPLTALAVCAFVGWLISLVSRRIRNQTPITVVLSLLFLVAYFYFYSKIMNGMVNLTLLGQQLASSLGGVWLLNLMGTAIMDGNWGNLCLSAILLLVPFLLACFVLSKTFFATVSVRSARAKVRYVEKQEKAESAMRALYRKERGKFLSSSVYLMNTGLGLFAMVAVAVALVIKWGELNVILTAIGPMGQQIPILLGFGMCFLTSMIDITAPSVSLEGKSIWVSRSMPVSTWEILKSKLVFHLSLAIPATLLPAIAAIVMGGFSPVDCLLLLLVPALCNGFVALLGLWENLCHPNLDWLNEVGAVKNSMAVLIAIFGSWAVVGIPAFLAVKVIGNGISGTLFFALFGLLLLLLDYLLYRLIRTKGVQKYESL